MPSSVLNSRATEVNKRAQSLPSLSLLSSGEREKNTGLVRARVKVQGSGKRGVAMRAHGPAWAWESEKAP